MHSLELFDSEPEVPACLLKTPEHSKLDYPYPKTEGVFSSNSVDELKNAIDENDFWTITEKLDGSNVCISSEGWIASRNQIIANFAQSKNWRMKKFNKQTLEHLAPLYDKIHQLSTILNNECDFELNLEEDQILLYGEFMLEGTAVSKHDIYNYKLQKYKPGHLFVFGIGFVFKTDIEKKEKLLETHFGHVRSFPSLTQATTYFVCPVNYLNKFFFDFAKIPTVPIVGRDEFNTLMTNELFIGQLKHRYLEGFVLTNSTNKIFKWKYQESTCDYRNAFAQHLRKELSHSQDQINVCNSLLKLYYFSNNYINSLDLPQLDVFLNTFLNKHAKKIATVLVENEIQKSTDSYNWDLKDYIQRLNKYAQTEIFQCFFNKVQYLLDKKISLEYGFLIFQKINKFVYDFLSDYEMNHQMSLLSISNSD